MSPGQGSSISQDVHVGVPLRVPFVASEGPFNGCRVRNLVIEENSEDVFVNDPDNVIVGLELVAPILELLHLPLVHDRITMTISEQYFRVRASYDGRTGGRVLGQFENALWTKVKGFSEPTSDRGVAELAGDCVFATFERHDYE